MIKISYTSYPEYPMATKASKLIRVGGWFIGALLLVLLIMAIEDAEYIWSIICIALIGLHIWIQSKHDAIILAIIKKQTPQSEINRELYISREELYKAKVYQRKAKYLLSAGKRSDEFQEEAKNAGMTLDEYKGYCKKCIDDYDEKYRRYNLTHDDRAEY